MDTASAKVRTRAETGVAGKEFDKVTFIALSAVAIGFGIFAFASLAGAAASVGLAGVAKSWFVAIGLAI